MNSKSTPSAAGADWVAVRFGKIYEVGGNEVESEDDQNVSKMNDTPFLLKLPNNIFLSLLQDFLLHRFAY